MNAQVERAYYAAVRADDALQAALVKEHGSNAGTARYQSGGSKRIQAAKMRKRKADERYRKAVAKMRKNPTRRTKKKVSLGPVAKILREAGVKRVQVMRNKAGRATGLKFLK